ncbi:hypothetical protein AAC03nite_14150 [Alicyclobacillus acidoterrestris]|uniref:DUF6504 family protein n=1 Tax=Alicyclobacillus suci TaxID=2816080 RepID=UPI0011922580|nr:DUF6504 family protein [Alicyclobacillus suci]GEO25630.1 hypothetical protein AAC03nite_14150 [Alicyclobacillus acidoterrestris]
MSRIVRQPIAVCRWQADDPVAFVHRGEVHTIVEILDRWVEMGDWWQGEGERKLLCVWTDHNALFELECTKQSWFVYKVWD